MSHNIVTTTNPPIDDFLLCRTFANAISSDTLLRTIEQQLIPKVEVSTSPNEDSQIMDNSTVALESIPWKVGDFCLCPYSEDGLLYRATIIDVSPPSCTVSFDDYGNEETHLLTELQIRTEDEEQLQQESSVTEHDPLPTSSATPLPPTPPPLPSFPVLNSNADNDTLSSTLMSWYLAGYHTGFYQGIKDKTNSEK